MNSKTLAVAAMLSAAAAAGALAHGGATGIVRERMDAMKAMGDVMKTLTPMMRGQVKYDEKVVREGAATIRKHAKGITRHFPEGSGARPSEARKEIWTDWSAFEALAKRLETLAGGLEAAAGNGLMAAPNPDSSSMMDQGMMSGQDMMGAGQMMGGEMPLPDKAALAAMPADGVFNMVALTCSSCHTRFRREED